MILFFKFLTNKISWSVHKIYGKISMHIAVLVGLKLSLEAKSALSHVMCLKREGDAVQHPLLGYGLILAMDLETNPQPKLTLCIAVTFIAYLHTHATPDAGAG